MSNLRTTNLDLPFIAPAQAQKHVTHNEALSALDALVHLSVLDRDLTTPPALPAEGNRYLVAAGGIDGWSGKDDQIAAFQDGVWAYFIPRAGWVVWVADENLLIAHDDTGWIGVENQTTSQFGVNTLADSTNRLSIKSDAVLHSHDDVTPGDGSARHVINKADSTDTASMIFQTNWSGRAEFGLTGNDDWRIKVSPDGVGWQDVIHADRNSGMVTFPSGVSGLREKLTTNRNYYVRADGSDTNDGRSDTAGGAFATLQKAFDIIGDLDTGIFTINLLVRAGTYAGGIIKPPMGLGALVIEGDRTTPSNVTVTNGAGNRGFWVQRPGTITIRGFKLTTTGTNIDLSATGIVATIADFELAGGSTGVAIGLFCKVSIANSWSVTANYSMIFSGESCYLATWGSDITFGTGVTVSVAYFYAAPHTSALLSNTNWTGTLTGKRCAIGSNCAINTQGGGDASIPGTTASSIGNYSTIS